jgi:hypothetical protein
MLVPHGWRALAAARFRTDTAAFEPNCKQAYALIFHHADNSFETRRLRHNQSMDIGQALK